MHSPQHPPFWLACLLLALVLCPLALALPGCRPAPAQPSPKTFTAADNLGSQHAWYYVD